MTPDALNTLNRQQLILKGLAAIITGVALCFLIGPALFVAGLPAMSAFAIIGLGFVVLVLGSITLAVAEKRML